jgi:hypothetical protein
MAGIEAGNFWILGWYVSHEPLEFWGVSGMAVTNCTHVTFGYLSRSRWSTNGTIDIGNSNTELTSGQDFSLLHSVQTGSGAHPASYPMGTGDFSPRGKAAGG